NAMGTLPDASVHDSRGSEAGAAPLRPDDVKKEGKEEEEGENKDLGTTTIATPSDNSINLDSASQQQQEEQQRQQQQQEEEIAPEPSTGKSFRIPGSRGISQRRGLLTKFCGGRCASGYGERLRNYRQHSGRRHAPYDLRRRILL